MPRSIIAIVVLFLVAASLGLGSPKLPLGARKPGATPNYGKLPLSFEANQGQADSRVRFLSRGQGYGVFLTATDAVLTLQSRSQRNAVLRMSLPGSNPEATIEGRDELPGKANYFIGNDPAQWRTNVSTYAKVQYRDVHPGIDLVYYGNQQQLEYDFLVAPGADPQAIRLKIEGADGLRVDNAGDLVVAAGASEVRWHRPVIYQLQGEARQEVAGGYRVSESGEVSFAVAAYDAKRSLVIDPTLVYSTFIGDGNAFDIGYGIAVDASGSAYITGETNTGFPLTNPFETTFANFAFLGGHAFVAKLNPTGTALVYSTYLGGTNYPISQGTFPSTNWGDQGNAIAVDSSGNASVGGWTTAVDFPTVNAFQPTSPANKHGFVTKLNASGSALVYSTYLGGSVGDEVDGLALDASGNAYVTGGTDSPDFPTLNAFQPAYGGHGTAPNILSDLGDAFVTKLSSAGALVYSTYLGGSQYDRGMAIAVDASGSAYVAGNTDSSNFPVANAFQPALSLNSALFSAGLTNGFVTKLSPSGTSLVYSTYLGSNTYVYAIAVSSSGNAYVTGETSPTSHPTTPGAFQTTGTGFVGYVTAFNPSGSSLLYSTLLGSGTGVQGFGISVDAAGNAYVAGATLAFAKVPTTAGAIATSATAGSAFLSILNPSGSALNYSTFLTGTQGNTFGYAIAVDSSGNAYLTGSSVVQGSGPQYPTTAGAYRNTIRIGGSASFVSKIGQAVVTTPPSIPAGGIVNGASFSKLPPAAGSIASLFGTNLANSTVAASSLPLPTSLGGVSVTVNGVAAPLFFVSTGQINFQIPWQAGSATVPVVVTVNGLISNTATLALASAGPGIFTINSSGSGQGAIQIANTTTFAAPSGSIPGVTAQPVARGQYITVYCSGLGAVQNPPVSGAAASGQTTVVAPSMTIGGVSVTPSFAGLAPGFVGLYQVNAQVPQSVTPGNAVAVVITANSVASNSVTIAVQ